MQMYGYWAYRRDLDRNLRDFHGNPAAIFPALNDSRIDFLEPFQRHVDDPVLQERGIIIQYQRLFKDLSQGKIHIKSIIETEFLKIRTLSPWEQTNLDKVVAEIGYFCRVVLFLILG